LVLRFPVGIETRTVEALLASMSGLPRGAAVIFDTLATADGVVHVVRADDATAEAFTRTLRVLLPGVRAEPTSVPAPAAWTVGARVGFDRRHLLLRDDGADAAAGMLLAALSPLRSDETVLVRVILRAAFAPRLPADRKGSRSPWWWFSTGDVSEDGLRGLRAKYARPLLAAKFEVAVSAGHPDRARQLLGRVATTLRSRRGSHGSPVICGRSGKAIGRSLERRRPGRHLLSPAELAGLIGWPVGSPQLPGLQLGATPLLLPDPRIPMSGRVLGRSNWPGARRRTLAQPIEGATSHTLITGPTGSGKSALLARLILADINAGRGVLVLDGKGDLITDLLSRVPAERADDVILVDPAAGGPVPGLRVFGAGTDPELTADLLLGVLRDLFRDSWGVRSDQWFRAGLVTLAHDPSATLGDFPNLFSDSPYREKTVATLTDPMLLATWAAFEAMNPREQANQLGAPLTKLSELLGRRVLRTLLSQQSPALDLTEAIERGRIVLVSLSPGRLGVPASRLLGALVVHGLYGAVQARAGLPASTRSPFLAYIDEPKVLGDIPVPLDGMFELARGMGVGLTISTQSLTQLAPVVRQAALTNSGSLITFRQTAEDAELLARHLSGVTSEALQHLDAYEVIARVGLGNGQIAAPATATTLPPDPETTDPAFVRARSAELYGADPAEVDQLLAARHKPVQVDAPVGKRRRS
jgi:hypothetical protein